ncbi:MAG: winged helix-turn-helix domain-containing protein [Candidatus Levybacteria bacterium]|nr:winged helix-turn-helix domain-containing protein [Candidatus Levybacteria bacterium]
MENTHFESLYPENSRFEEIEKIIGFIKNGNSCQLIGLPGVGRSNLLGLLSFNKNIREKHLLENQKWFHFVNLNFSEIRKKPFYDCLKFIFLALSESLRERKSYKGAEERFATIDAFDKVDEIFKEAISAQDELVLFAGLKRAIDYLCIEKKLTVVFLFDRFEEYIPMLSAEFFANLRILRNRAKYRFSIVFSLNRPLEDLVGPILFADFYEFLADKIVFLPISDKPGLDFRISYLEKTSGKHIDKKIIEEIITLTAGHGKLTRLCLEAIISNEQNNKDLKSYFLNLKSIQGSLYEIWYSLNPEEQKMLINNKLINNDYLQNIGLVRDGKIAIPLFKELINKTLLHQDFGRAQQLTFNPQTNEIRRGDIVLSDALTSSELKLLKYLLENKGKIIERDEIIKAVWQDSKSTEGVTDQALDQLIFRLRKKIEEDPNNPSCIQTVKGRGIRFTDS